MNAFRKTVAVLNKIADKMELFANVISVICLTIQIATIVVLVITSLRKKREDQPPASLGLAYFREER